MHRAVPLRVVLARREKVRHTADHLKGRWVIRTNEGRPISSSSARSDRAPDDRAGWRTLVPGRDQATLEDFTLLERGIAVQERVDADSRVRLLAGGRWLPVAAVPASTVTLGDNRDPRAAHLRYSVTSMVQPRPPGTCIWPAASACCARCARCPATTPPSTPPTASGRRRATASASRSRCRGGATVHAPTAPRRCW